MRPIRTILRTPLHGFFWLLLLFTLPFTLPSLELFFSGDHVMNLYQYVKRPEETLVNNLVFWTSFHRPLGGVVHLVIHTLFGMQPFWYWLFSIILFSLNTLLLLALYWRITNDKYLALVAAGFAVLHPENYNVWYNFGAIYELLVFGFLISAFLCYLLFLEAEKGDKSRYWLCLILFIAALNSKEIAVVFPAILAGYELIYRWDHISKSFGPVLLRLVPLFVISGVYALGKVLGREALWRNNSAYHYQLDETAYCNLHGYFDLIVHRVMHFNDATLAWSLVSCLLLALLLRNRHMLFGLWFFLLTILPVLPLPRVWGLYLYVPLIGASLFLGSLGLEIGKRLVQIKCGREWICVGVFYFVLYWAASGYVDGALENRRAFSREWRGFIEQLLEKYPVMSSNALLGFENAPVREGLDYHLHFLVALMYEDLKIKVFRLPEQEDAFLRAKPGSGESHHFDYADGRLVEVDEKVSPSIGETPLSATGISPH